MKIRPIRTEQGYEAALDRAMALIPTKDQSSLDELEILQALIERWERDQFSTPSVSAIEAINFRMKQGNLAPRDLIPYIGTRSRVSEVLSGTRSLSLDMIKALNEHLSIPAKALIRSKSSSRTQRRSSISQAALSRLRELGCLKARESIEAFLLRAFGEPSANALLRKSRTVRTNAKTDFAAVEAWCAAVTLRSQPLKVSSLAKKPTLKKMGRELARLSANPQGPSQVAEALAEVGIVFVVLEHLPGTYLDGASILRNDGVPIIALTTRHDRIDNFWFTLLHEFCHVAEHLKSDVSIILDDLEIKGDHKMEMEADKFAQEALIPAKLATKVRDPDLSTEDVMELSAKAGVHPAIVAGRWQRENNDYRRFSKLLGRGEIRKVLVTRC